MKPETKHDACEKGETGFFSFLNPFKKDKSTNPSESLKEAVDAYLEDSATEDINGEEGESLLLSNVLALKDLDVTDIMIPRADIVAIEVSSTNEELLELLTEKQFSRLPVYKETLDEILGTIHIKDILAKMTKNEPFDIQSLTRDAPIVSPAMPILDLVHLMRQRRRHLVMVVDEYGGIDGLVTIGDVIEEVLGEIDDEYNVEDDSNITKKPDGTYILDARILLDDLEKEIEQTLQIVEDDDVDTLGGLISFLAGRLPARGEIIEDPKTGACFEILDADPRKIKQVHLTLHAPKLSDKSDE